MDDYWKKTAGPMPHACRSAQPNPRSEGNLACRAQPYHGELDKQAIRQVVRNESPMLMAEPGFFIVPKSMPPAKLMALLFDEPAPAVLIKFSALNPSISNPVKAGAMIVLGDPNNKQCSYEEAQLMKAAAQVNTALEHLTADEADVMSRHYGEISFSSRKAPPLLAPARQCSASICKESEIRWQVSKTCISVLFSNTAIFNQQNSSLSVSSYLPTWIITWARW